MDIRRLLILIVLFSLAVPAMADPSTLHRFDSLQYAVFRTARFGGDNIPAAESLAVKSYVNRAIQRVSRDLPAVVKTDTITLDTNQISYTQDSTFRAPLNAILYRQNIEDSVMRPLMIITPDVLPPIIEREAIPQADAAPFYLWSVGRQVYLWPVPRQADYVYLEYAAYGVKLSGASDTTDVLEAYRELVVLAAAINLRRDLDLEWESWEAEYRRRTGQSGQ